MGVNRLTGINSGIGQDMFKIIDEAVRKENKSLLESEQELANEPTEKEIENANKEDKEAKKKEIENKMESIIDAMHNTQIDSEEAEALAKQFDELQSELAELDLEEGACCVKEEELKFAEEYCEKCGKVITESGSSWKNSGDPMFDELVEYVRKELGFEEAHCNWHRYNNTELLSFVSEVDNENSEIYTQLKAYVSKKLPDGYDILETSSYRAQGGGRVYTIQIKLPEVAECDEKLKEGLKEDSYDTGIFYEIEQAFIDAGLNPSRFIDDGILTKNIGWTVTSPETGESQQISCDGSWYDEDETDECDKSETDECDKKLTEAVPARMFKKDIKSFSGLITIAKNREGKTVLQFNTNEDADEAFKKLTEWYNAPSIEKYGNIVMFDVRDFHLIDDNEDEVDDITEEDKITETEVKNIKPIKQQGNVFMLEDENGKVIVGEDFNEEDGIIQNAEVYENKEEADKDYLDRCNVVKTDEGENCEKTEECDKNDLNESSIENERDLAKYIAENFEKITGVDVRKVFSKGKEDTAFNQKVVDETSPAIEKFIKEYNEKNKTDFDFHNEDLLDLIDEELLSVRTRLGECDKPIEECNKVTGKKLSDFAKK